MLKNKLTSEQSNQTELSDSAKNDLNQIWEYIQQDNSEYADNLIRGFLQKFKVLAQNPKIGKPEDKYFLNLRSFPFKKHVIFYIPTENGIEIFRVIHSSRNIEGIFDEFFDNLK